MDAKIWVKIRRNAEGEKEYTPQLTFGVSTVTFGRSCETLQEALWYNRIMQINLEGAGVKKILMRKRPSKSINCPIK